MLELLLDPGLKKITIENILGTVSSNVNTDFTSDHIMELLLISMRNCLIRIAIKTSKFKI